MMAPCDDDSLFISTITQDEYHAIDYIWSDALIMSPDNILYTAGIDIDLVADFEVELGAEFEARIEACQVLFRTENETTNHSSNLASQLSLMAERIFGSHAQKKEIEIIGANNESTQIINVDKNNFGIAILQYISTKDSGIFYIRLKDGHEADKIERLIWVR